MQQWCHLILKMLSCFVIVWPNCFGSPLSSYDYDLMNQRFASLKARNKNAKDTESQLQ